MQGLSQNLGGLMFGKLFAQTFNGSMFGAGAHVFATWAYAIASAKTNGTVELNPKVLAGTIGMSVKQATEAIDYLCAPDTESRTPDQGGRRLIHEGGFLYLIVNIGKYRGIRNEEERREYLRLAKRKSRARQRDPGEEG